MERKYNNSPIIEALCAFQFVPAGQLWDLTIPGRIYERIKSDFPEKSQHSGLGLLSMAIERGREYKIGSIPPKMYFFTKDKTWLVQVGPDLLVVNKLKPYNTWHQFKSEILRHLQIYNLVAPPRGIKQIGLRYINIIDIKPATIELEDYFSFYPHVPKSISEIPTSFFNRIELPYRNKRDKIILTLASDTPEDKNSISVLLDLDYISISEAISLGEIDGWLEDAHSSLYDVFESCIKEKCRALFEEIAR